MGTHSHCKGTGLAEAHDPPEGPSALEVTATEDAAAAVVAAVVVDVGAVTLLVVGIAGVVTHELSKVE